MFREVHIRLLDIFLTASILSYLAVSVPASTSKREVIYNAGAALCPCLKFCNKSFLSIYNNRTNYRKGDLPFSGAETNNICEDNDVYEPQESDSSSQVKSLSVLCCGNCSCDNDCWKTASCCPDKDNIEDKPTLMCKSPVVKPFPRKTPGSVGYYVVDSCPRTEENVTLISQCTATDKTELEDYIWVYNSENGLTYQNKYCALCHQVYDFKTWRMNSKCSRMPPLGNLERILMSKKCQLKLETPVNVSLQVCLIPDYESCNETGAWTSYDAEIERACYSYQSLYFVQIQNNKNRIGGIAYAFKSFRNVFCYYCNTEQTSPANLVCNISPNVGQGNDNEATQLIEFTNYHPNDNDPEDCKKDEVMDKILGYCRLLICPFGTRQSQGECEAIFETSRRLPMRIQFGLTVVWSKNNYSFTDDFELFINLGEHVLKAITESPDSFEHSPCSHSLCTETIRMVAYVVENELESSGAVSNISLPISGPIAIDTPAFLYLVDLTTDEEHCQLEDIYTQITKMSDKHLLVNLDGEFVMQLYVSLFNENGQDFYQHREYIKLARNVYECQFNPAFTIKDKVCPKVSLIYSEFSKYVTEPNRETIESLFTKNQIRTDEAVDTCLLDYYNTLSAVELKTHTSTHTSTRTTPMLESVFTLPSASATRMIDAFYTFSVVFPLLTTYIL